MEFNSSPMAERSAVWVSEADVEANPHAHTTAREATTKQSAKNAQSKPKAKRWKPKKGERFYRILPSIGDLYSKVDRWEWHNVQYDNRLYRLGNCFKTKREAQDVARKLKGFWKSVREGKE